ncbi:MAG: sigma-54 dependent transcriptional regulator, partial [Thermodesulfobacteriota bacterium]|nr:sigma-54 dependent transcriptional regulator [Thermodesulfobacteriota bacterium]
YQSKYKKFFGSNGFNVLTASKAPQVLALLQKSTAEIVLIGFKKLPTSNAPLAKLLDLIKYFDQRIEVLLVAPKFSREFATQSIKRGAADCISDPEYLEAILDSLNKLLEFSDIRKQTGLLEQQIRDHYTFKGMISKNPYMLEIFDLIRRLANHFNTIFITGETGTGKELVARALHDLSPRTGQQYVACNCSAFPESLLERELFGHVKGSFTGATDSKPGLFEFADGGTVFLDEIGEMELPLQAKLLRVLENQTIRRIGSPDEVSVDVQVITATNRDLRSAIKDKRFREDLFYRINVIEIHLPPLRERKEDIPLLCHHFLSQFNTKFDKNIKGISRKAQILLMNHQWEGNVRELQNVIESGAILTTKDHISDDDVQKQLEKTKGARTTAIPYGDNLTLEEVERQHISRVLEKTGGNKVQAAALLGLSRSALSRKIEKLKIQ